jgi:hypothetical protein
LFHGAAALAARERFCAELGADAVPTTERAFRELTGQPSLFAEGGVTAADTWRAAHDAARGAT